MAKVICWYCGKEITHPDLAYEYEEVDGTMSLMHVICSQEYANS